MMSTVTLNEENHTYRDSINPNRRFISVTTLIGKYEHEFDEDFYAEKIAQRDGTTKAVILAEWKCINEEANEYGTNLHKIMERYLLNQHKLYIPQGDFEKLVISAYQQLNITPDHKKLKPEYVMSYPFDELRGLAGMCDIIEDVDEMYFNIWDFKTNKKFNYVDQYKKWLKFPLDHLSQCQYNIYAVQLSIYAYLYELETGKKCGRMGLLYWQRKEEKFEIIPINYMKREITTLFNHFRGKFGEVTDLFK